MKPLMKLTKTEWKFRLNTYHKKIKTHLKMENLRIQQYWCKVMADHLQLKKTSSLINMMCYYWDVHPAAINLFNLAFLVNSISVVNFIDHKLIWGWCIHQIYRLESVFSPLQAHRVTHLPDFWEHRRVAVQLDAMLHKFLNAVGLDLLKEGSGSFLPGPKVDLC